MTDVRAVDGSLVERIHTLVRAYVLRKTETRSGIKWDDFKDKKTATGERDVPQRYRDAREKICTATFLRLRACHAREDFVSYFTGTICSIPQYLPEAEYEAVAKAVLSDESWEEVKALAMLTLSACLESDPGAGKNGGTT